MGVIVLDCNNYHDTAPNKLVMPSNIGYKQREIEPGHTSDPECGAMSEANWYVVQTVANGEYQALRNLSQIGFRCHLPQFVRMRKLMKHGRQVIENGKAREEESIRPLFPGYLFVSFGNDYESWGQINRTHGVARLFTRFSGMGQLPIAMPAGEIEALIARGRAGDGVIDDRAPAFAPIAAGASVRIKDGALADHVGICQMSDKTRVELLVSLLGAERRVTLARNNVELV